MRGVAGLLAALLLSIGAAAEDWTWALAKDLMSPFCPGRTLADCPSEQAQTLIAWISVQEAAGRERADVEAELLERYGDVILAAPRAEGIGITAYAIPAAAFLAGGALVAVFLRRQTRGSPDPPPAAPLRPASGPGTADAELERALDDELAG